ncbi:hypothetical protein H4219_000710 [Mycoemilia scoparia]|uniref:SWIRM domain-containing protein n=1 Tax=Mycoemilia scoparia TaxID=417184 RepID=A0A9W8A298_9FUNG|nr:hypothetical protein H4219_000710 [Mycoemilia scoparia]
MNTRLAAAPSPSSMPVTSRRHSLGMPRINKRKQSHPMRSPIPSNITTNLYDRPDAGSPLKSCQQQAAMTTDRAFCFSFLDDYSRNQQAYIKALHGPGSTGAGSYGVVGGQKSSSPPSSIGASHMSGNGVGGGRMGGFARNSSVASGTDDTSRRARGGAGGSSSTGNNSEGDDSSIANNSMITPSATSGVRKRVRQNSMSNSNSAADGGDGGDRGNDDDLSAMDLDSDDSEYMSLVPPNNRSSVKWTKAEPINISNKPYFSKLAPAEQHCCSVLRIAPEQYLTIKRTLIREGRTRQAGTFKKRDAQRLCRIDVNKTSKIYEWYVKIGWLPDSNGNSIYSEGSAALAGNTISVGAINSNNNN